MKSFLFTDFGIGYTRSILIDVVEGQYRLISGTLTRTTIAPPDNDVTLGLVRNLEQLQTQTGRLLLGEEGLIRPSRNDGSGFDEFIATASSAGRPLRATLVGLMDGFSLQSAQNALTGTYVEAVKSLSLIDIQTEEDRVNAILRDNPDVIVIVGGTNTGNEESVRELIRLVELAVRLEPVGERPIVLYAGNDRLAKWAKARLDDFCVTFTADNVRPELGEAAVLTPIKLKLAQVFDNFLKHQPGGFADVSESSATGITPTAQSAARLVRYLDTLSDAGAMYLDIGSGTSTLLISREGEAASSIRSTLGLGHNILEVLTLLDWRDVERWLPFAFSLTAFEEWAHNKALAPLTIPQTLRELFIEHAVTREIARILLADVETTTGRTLPPFTPIILGGAVFTGNLPPGLAVLLVLDALQPVGVFELYSDPYALTPALGAIGALEPLAAVQVVDNGGFVRLATVFAPIGRSAARARMSIELTLANGDTITNVLTPGHIWLPDLPKGVWVDVSVRLSRGLTLNGKRDYSGRLQTGTAGLVFDMRGRPLAIPAGRKRRENLAAWFAAMTGIALDLEALNTAPSSDGLGVAAVGGINVSTEDFPRYRSLPKGELAPEIAELLANIPTTSSTTEDDFGLELEFPDFESAEDDTNDLAKELGLR